MAMSLPAAMYEIEFAKMAADPTDCKVHKDFMYWRTMLRQELLGLTVKVPELIEIDDDSPDFHTMDPPTGTVHVDC